jgi:uncharacterized protein YcgI (DUF1989 family)
MSEDGRSTSTATVHGARDHARAQAGSATAQAVTTRPTIPATHATDLPAGVDPAAVVWDETLGDDGYASRVVRRGVHLRIADVAGDANVNLMLHHAARPIERLNVADTVKLQWNAYPGAGSLLLSDMGRVLGTVLPDSTGAVDPLCGASTWRGRARLLLGLAKHGLTRRDLPPALNLFTAVRVEADGGLRLGAPSPAGDHVTLRAELDLLVTVAVTPHPLDDVGVSAPPGTPVETATGPLVRLTAWQDEPAGGDDPARRTSPETQRAFENTDDVLTALP